MKRLNITLGLVILSLLFLNTRPTSANSQASVNVADLEYLFIPMDTISFEALSQGQPGEGFLIYFLEEVPKLIVRLENTHEGKATAEVYDNTFISNNIQVDKNLGEVIIRNQVQPVMILQSLDGWWTRSGKTSFNLDVEIYGPIHATWGGENILALDQISSDEKIVEISIRDTDNDGLPDWDFRKIIPTLKGFGILRTNYVEKMCSFPVNLEDSISPLWPYVAFDGRFEQGVNALRPPIVMDWEKGRVKYFSEIVTARVQPCSYTLYTLDSLKQDAAAQKTDLEAPLTFYNLSGETASYGNLILRTERFFENNTWAGGNNPDWETIRYSWRNKTGDWYWDYKVEVLGFHPFQFTTNIAGGELVVDAPSYEHFPTWVLENTWPVATFVDAEGNPYRSSEGLYDWSPKEIGKDYFLGRADEMASESFSHIREGFRGEFRILKEEKPHLYLSRIDNRLHLLGAGGGLWNLGDGEYIEILNLSEGPHIDGWQRVQHVVSNDNQKEREIIESLYHHNVYLIYSTESKIIFKKIGIDPNKEILLPPHDHETWLAFRSRVEPVTDYRKDPQDLQSWMSSFSGKTVEISGAVLSDLTMAENRMSFSLQISPTKKSAGNLDIPLRHLSTGKYWIAVDNGAWKVRDFLPAQVNFRKHTLRIERLSTSAHQPVRVAAGVENLGNGSSGPVTAALWITKAGSPPEMILSKEFILKGGQEQQVQFIWHPESPGDYFVELRLSGESVSPYAILQSEIQVLPSGMTQLERAFILSQPSSTTLILLLLWGVAMGGVAIVTLITQDVQNK